MRRGIVNYVAELGNLNRHELLQQCIVQITNSNTLRAQARVLRGTDAVTLCDHIHEVQRLDFFKAGCTDIFNSVSLGSQNSQNIARECSVYFKTYALRLGCFLPSVSYMKLR